MNLCSFTPRRLFKHATSTKLFGICALILMTSQNVHAFDLGLNSSATKNTSVESLKKLNYRNLINGNIIKNLPNLIVIKPKDAAYMADIITNRYLTFYSKKNKKLNATFENGAYVIRYTQNW